MSIIPSYSNQEVSQNIIDSASVNTCINRVFWATAVKLISFLNKHEIEVLVNTSKELKKVVITGVRNATVEFIGELQEKTVFPLSLDILKNIPRIRLDRDFGNLKELKKHILSVKGVVVDSLRMIDQPAIEDGLKDVQPSIFLEDISKVIAKYRRISESQNVTIISRWNQVCSNGSYGLAINGIFNWALEVAHSISENFMKNKALIHIAKQLVKAGDIDTAINVLTTPIEAVYSIINEMQKFECLVDVADVFYEIGDVHQANHFLEQTLNFVERASLDVRGEAVIYAARNNNLMMVRFLLVGDKLISKDGRGEAVIEAVINNNLEMLRLLLECDKVIPKYNRGIAVRGAAENNNLEMVCFLLEGDKVIPEEFIDQAVVCAAYNNNLEMVRLLLEGDKVIPEEYIDQAVSCATKHNNLEMVCILSKVKGGYSDDKI